MKALLAAFVLAIGASNAVAQTSGPLPAGKPAGIRQAQMSPDEVTVIVAAAALIGIGIALATSTDSTPPTSTANSTTSTVTP